MGVRVLGTVLLLFGILCTTCTALFVGRRDSGTACERLQTAGMAVYNDALFMVEGQILHEYGPERISAILCDVADARTLDDVTDAIDPNLPPFIRDAIQLYYIVGTSVIEFLGGVDGVKTRVNFVRAWADFARDNNLGEGSVSYDVAYEFTSGLVNTYGDDFLKTLARGTTLIAGRRMMDENDVIYADKLARALSENLDSPLEFAQTSELSLPTTEYLGLLINHVTSPPADHFYPLITRFVDSYLVWLETVDDMQLLDLELAA